MSIKNREIAILVGLTADIDSGKTEYSPSAREDYTQYKRVRAAHDETAICDPGKWLGIEITASQSVMNSRSYKRLEESGFVERVHSEHSIKTSALRLTPQGRAEVERLTQSAAK